MKKTKAVAGMPPSQLNLNHYNSNLSFESPYRYVYYGIMVSALLSF